MSAMAFWTLIYNAIWRWILSLLRLARILAWICGWTLPLPSWLPVV